MRPDYAPEARRTITFEGVRRNGDEIPMLWTGIQFADGWIMCRACVAAPWCGGTMDGSGEYPADQPVTLLFASDISCDDCAQAAREDD